MLLLLDIDGVMVPANSWRRPEILEDGFVEFSPKAIEALNKILKEHVFEIVLTTSHKFKYTLADWREIFNKRGVNVNTVKRLNDNTNNLNKKNEIINWFNTKADLDNFIILDDDKSLNDLPALIKSRLVQTSASVGLTQDIADEVIALANPNLV
ncbi:HAD domain-containing protein [Pedobacter endophyticus]|uniref:FCP1 homology domain-containing protein n=1 Tax=Pedobacter endophyticus TaxID=2789740 RepID=A0A7S9L0R4_9SPHI|nr:HAD domain-containing protein [Pedobacter endophyticus]QPH40332.1 hypothetical protein IZT61_03365 [Pedobacter endophyticus]